MTPVTQGRGTDMLLKYIPHWLIVLLIVVVIIIILAWIIGAIGGFDWHFDIGHFHWDLGVTKT